MHLDSPRTVGSISFDDTTPSNNWTIDNNGDPTNSITLAVSSGTPSIQVTSQSATISATLAGIQGLSTSGALTLSGVNTYSGVTTIAGGTLTIASDAALGLVPASPAFNLNFGSPATLRFAADMTLNSNRTTKTQGTDSTFDTQSFHVFYGGAITDSLSGYTKRGSGTLTLSGINTTTSATTVAEGTLQLAGAGTLSKNTAGLAINGGALDLNGTSQNVGALNGAGGMILNNSSGSSSTLSIGNGDATGTYAGIIANNSSGTGLVSLAKTGSGTETLTGLNTYTGPTIVNGGTLVIRGSTGGLNAGSSLVIGAGTFNYQGKSSGSTQALTQLSLSGGESTVQSTYGTSGTTSVTFASFNRAGGGTGTFVTSGGTNGVTNKIVLSTVPANSFVDPGAFYQSTSTAFAWNDAAAFMRAINYSTDPGAVMTAGAASVSGNHIRATGSITVQPTSAITSLNLSGSSNLTLAAGASLTVSGILKTGNNSATISGGTAIQPFPGGQIVIRNDQPSDALTINTPLISNGANQLTLSGPGAVVLGAANPYNGVLFVANGSLQLNNSNSLVNATVSLNTASQFTFGSAIGSFTMGGLSGVSNIKLTDITLAPISLTIGNNSANTQYSGILSGSGGLVKVGSGTTTLTGGNTYLGGLTINGGRLQASGAGTFGSAQEPVTLNSGVLDLNGTNQSIGSLNGTGGMIVNNRSGLQALLTLNNTVSSIGIYSGVIADHTTGTGTLAIALATASRASLKGVNSYSGGTTINQNATLTINSDAALGAVPSSPTPNISFSSSSLVFDGDFTSVPLNSNRSIVTTFNANLGTVTDVDYGGSISGAGGITKGGLAALRLRGISTFAGPAIVNGGLLTLDGNTGRFNSTVPLTVGQATFLYQGKIDGSSQALATLTFSGGDGLVQTNYGTTGTTAVSFTSVSRASGSAGTLLASGGTNGVSNRIELPSSPVNSLVDPGVFFSRGIGSSYAWTDATRFARAIDYANDSGAATTSGGTAVMGSNVQVTGPITAQPTSVLTTLNIAAATSFTLADNAVVTVNSMLKTGNNAGTVGGGAALQAPLNSDLVIRNDQASDTLRINTPIVANGLNPLTLVGPGTTVLGGANTYNGTTLLAGGRLELQNSLAVQNTTINNFSGTVLTFGPGIGTFTVPSVLGVVDLTDTEGNPVTLRIGNNNVNARFFGGGNGSLVKIGTGSLTTSGTYTGGVVIESGTVVAGGDSTFGAIPTSPTINIEFRGSSTITFNSTVTTVAANRIILIDAGVTATLNAVATGGNGITIAGVITGSGSLTKTGVEALTFAAANTYTGDTTPLGTLILANGNAVQYSTVHTGPIAFGPSIGSFVFGGLIGTGGLALVDSGGAPILLKIGNNNASTIYSGVMSGSGAFVKVGTGTLTLSGANTYAGNTMIGAGILNVTGSLPKNGSDTVYLSAGSDFGLSSLVRQIASGATYSGIGTTSSGQGMGTSADLRAGKNSTGSALALAMQWRFRNPNDPTTLISDVLNLTGMSAGAGEHVQTNPFTLQLTYAAATLGDRESDLAARGLIGLNWLNTALNQPTGVWQNATAGNFGTGLAGSVFQNVQSSWDAFAAAHSVTDTNLGNFLGSYGVDVAHHQVWAVIHHNSQFSVVPEPSSLALSFLPGLVGLSLGLRAVRARRRLVDGRRFRGS